MPIGSVTIGSVGAGVDERSRTVDLWMSNGHAGSGHVIHSLGSPSTSVYEPGLKVDPTLSLTFEEAQEMYNALGFALGKGGTEEAAQLKRDVDSLTSRLTTAEVTITDLDNQLRVEISKSFKLATSVEALEKVDSIRQDHLKDLQKMLSYLQLSVEAEPFNGNVDALMRLEDVKPEPAGTPKTSKGRGDF